MLQQLFPQFQYFQPGENGPTYGFYGGLNYSAGMQGGTITGIPPNPVPVDAYDEAFFRHDLALQTASTPAERLDAHIDVVEDVSGLLSVAFSQTFDLYL